MILDALVPVRRFFLDAERLYGGDRQRRQTECNKLEERGRLAQLFSTFFCVASLSARHHSPYVLLACTFFYRRGLAFRETIAGPLEEEKKKKKPFLRLGEPRAIIRIVMGYRIITCRLSDGSVVDRLSREDRGNLNCFPTATFFHRF